MKTNEEINTDANQPSFVPIKYKGKQTVGSSDSVGFHSTKNLDRTIVIRINKSITIPFSASKEQAKKNNLLVNRGPQPGPSSSDDSK